VEKTIQQLFLKFIRNQCNAHEIEQVKSLINTGSYEKEWLAAMEAAANDEASSATLNASHKAKLFKKITAKADIKQAKKNNWLVYAAASVFVIVTAGVILQLSQTKVSTAPISQATAKTEVPQQSAKKWIKLPDGTSVQLNTDSKLEYPDSFEGATERRVSLQGEAYFDVKHLDKQPFVISTGKITVTVLGTAFNIKSSKDQQDITVTVTRGKVKVQKDQKLLGYLTQNQQLSWSAVAKEPVIKQSHVNTEIATAWKAEDIIMDDISLAEAADLIAKRYQLKVNFENNKLRDCKFTAAFLERNKLDQILNVIGDITNTKLSVNPQQTLVISGDGCN
jgi:ferric-dicitrate binding protein FerR (iron transport regulator)